MFCKNCGKEISDEAFMCPSCGTPTDNILPKKEVSTTDETKSTTNENKNHIIAISTIAFILSIFSFIAGVTDAFLIPIILSNIIISFSILPSFASFSIGIYILVAIRNQKSGIAKSFSIVAIVFASITVLFLFIMLCIFGAEYSYYYYR